MTLGVIEGTLLGDIEESNGHSNFDLGHRMYIVKSTLVNKSIIAGVEIGLGTS